MSSAFSLKQINEWLRQGDIGWISELTKYRRLNNGKGYSYDYVRRVLDIDDPRHNNEIMEVAKEVAQMRAKAKDQSLQLMHKQV